MEFPLAVASEEEVELARRTLAASELSELERLQVEKRRRDWLLGRLAAKRAVSAVIPVGLEEVSIDHDELGAPVARVASRDSRPLSLSLTHGHGLAAAWASDRALVGVDLERIRDRPEGTFRFYLAGEERARYVSAVPAGAARDEAAIVLWALKEAAWKALRPGRGAAILDARLELDGPASGVRGTARVGYRGPLAERARELGVLPSGTAWWARRGDVVFAWCLVER